jgi:hypothetical protein
MDSILNFISDAGSLSSALLGVFALAGIFASKTKNGKEWIKNALGIVALSQRLEEHLACDEEVRKQSSLQSKALLSNLRKDLKYMCIDALDKGYVTANELEMITQAYDVYEQLLGNSFIKGLVEKVKMLEVKEDNF